MIICVGFVLVCVVGLGFVVFWCVLVVVGVYLIGLVVRVGVGCCVVVVCLWGWWWVGLFWVGLVLVWWLGCVVWVGSWCVGGLVLLRCWLVWLILLRSVLCSWVGGIC